MRYDQIASTRGLQTRWNEGVEWDPREGGGGQHKSQMHILRIKCIERYSQLGVQMHNHIC